jgi:hypothetical protein
MVDKIVEVFFLSFIAVSMVTTFVVIYKQFKKK